MAVDLDALIVMRCKITDADFPTYTVTLSMLGSYHISADTFALVPAAQHEAMVAELRELRAAGEWRPIGDGLPAVGEPVALINVNEWESTGAGGPDRNVQACGYLSDWGEKYWSVSGQPAQSINAYTHFRPLPAPPVVPETGE